MLFIHDHTFINKGGEYYTTGSLNQRVMDRYKSWFGTCSVFATTRKAEEKDMVFVRDENKVQNLDFNLVKKKNSIIHLIKICRPMEKAVKSADCIVVRMSIFGAIGVHYAKKNKIPYLIEMVACPWDSLWYHSKKGKILAPFMTLLTKRICKQAPYVLYVTNEFLQKRYPTKGVSIGCSDVELTNIDEGQLKKRLDKIASLNLQKKIKIYTLANVSVKYKGQDIIIKSLKKLAQNGLDCEYYLVGGGNPERLKKLALELGVSEKVKIIGPVPHADVFEFIDSMDICIQPSNQEGLPRAVIESMSRGCPVVGSSTGGIPELIDSCMVFKKGSDDGFVDVMKTINYDKLETCARNNFLKSMEYEKKYLDKKRSDFYLAFAKEARRGNQ